MKLNFEFNNLAKSPVKANFVKKIVLVTLESVLRDKIQKNDISLSLAIVSEEEIKKYNKLYRRHNQPTDVLTFCEYKNRRELEKALAGEKEIFLGEALLCYNDIEKYCRNNNKNINKELAEVISHGILHMLGLRHGQKMFQFQKEAAAYII